LVIMNRTRYDFTGGHPLILDNLKFDQDAVREAIARIFGGSTNNTNCIVSGLSFTSPSATQIQWTSGYIYFQDEFYFVNSGSRTLISPPSGVRLRAVQNISYTSIDPQVFNSGAQRNIHELRRCDINLLTQSAGPDAADPRMWPRFPDAILQAMSPSLISQRLDLTTLLSRLANADIWHVVGDPLTGLNSTFNSGWGSLNQPTVQTVAFRKDASGIIRLRGIALRPSGGPTTANYHIFTLPPGYRPPLGSYAHLNTGWINTYAGMAGYTAVPLIIKDDGEVHVGFQPMNTLGRAFILDGLSFMPY
jgi:hypothetical protein